MKGLIVTLLVCGVLVLAGAYSALTAKQYLDGLERAKVAAEAKVTSELCDRADDKVKAIEVCATAKLACLITPADLYEARQASKFAQAVCMETQVP